MTKSKDREFITNVIPKSNGSYTVYRGAKKNQKSFRITQKLLQGIVAHTKKIKARKSNLIITIPANERENYIIECTVNKKPKV